jgi:hypothetical protein
MDTEHKLKCRKCGGPHLTIKCKGSENIDNKIETPKPKSEKQNDISQNQLVNESLKHTSEPSKPKFDREKQYNRKQTFKNTYRVRVSELPTDISEDEMLELTHDWGHIVRLKVLAYSDSSTSYIDFGYEEEADYFVKALDKTPFDHRIISVARVEAN